MFPYIKMKKSFLRTFWDSCGLIWSSFTLFMACFLEKCHPENQVFQVLRAGECRRHKFSHRNWILHRILHQEKHFQKNFNVMYFRRNRLFCKNRWHFDQALWEHYFQRNEEISNWEAHFVENFELIPKPFSKVVFDSWEPSYGISKKEPRMTIRTRNIIP